MADEPIVPGKFVQVAYNITDESGQVTEQSDSPVGFVHGSDEGLLQHVEDQLLGKVVGDTIVIEVPPEQGFGHRDPKLTFTDDLANVPAEFQYLGAQVEMRNEAGETRIFTVSNISNGKLTADGNHPYAGKTMTFHLTVTEVRDPTPAELMPAAPANTH